MEYDEFIKQAKEIDANFEVSDDKTYAEDLKSIENNLECKKLERAKESYDFKWLNACQRLKLQNLDFVNKLSNDSVEFFKYVMNNNKLTNEQILTLGLAEDDNDFTFEFLLQNLDLLMGRDE